MDSFDLDNFNFDKSTAMKRFNRLRSLAKFIRFLEFFAAVVLLTWLSARAPLVVKASGDYLRRFIATLASPIFVFFLGNAIVVALFAKSGHLTRSSGPVNAESKICEELSSNVQAELQVEKENEIVFQDKEIICEEIVTPTPSKVVEDQNPRILNSELSDVRLYRRSESDIVKKRKTCNEILRRSVTDLRRKTADVSESKVKEHLDDGMSNDEFRRTIEEFIAKQVKFHQEESHSVVVHTSHPHFDKQNIMIQ